MFIWTFDGIVKAVVLGVVLVFLFWVGVCVLLDLLKIWIRKKRKQLAAWRKSVNSNAEGHRNSALTVARDC